MAIQEFSDEAGVRWRVWATTPSRGNVRPQFAAGWLAFESGSERRRLAPIPAGWSEVDDAALCEMLAQATVIIRHATPASVPVAEEPAREPGALEATVARVRAVIQSVDATLQGQAAG
ncbi:MAG TPA: hypothetical protein VGX50_09415 [Longimicrobium sp.]|nr:hypothetical protein [Longimicrobium sp.]